MSKFTKKALTVAVAFVTIVSMTGVTKAATTEELQAQIAALLAQISSLQASMGTTATTGTTYNFTTNLTLGAKGSEVSALQQMLINGGFLNITAPTAYFGSMTKAALVKWQTANGVSPASGYFGPLSRAKANSMTGGSTGGTVVIPSASYIKAEGVGMVAQTIPTGSLYNKVLTVKFSAGKDAVNVTGITLTRGGYIANTKITGVSIWDDAGNRYGNIITSLTSDGKVTFSFGNTPFTVNPGTSKNMIVSINLEGTSYTGTVNFSVNAASDIKTSSTEAVQGTFPIIGTIMSITDGTNSIADARVSDQTVAGISSTTAMASGNGNIEIGQSQIEVGKFRITQNNSKEGIYLKKMVVYVGGNIQESKDVKNWKLYSQEGNVLATADAPVDRFVTFTLSNPYFIDKGLTRDFSVKADIMDGSDRYFYTYIQNDYDLVITGATTGANILVKDSSNGTFDSNDTQTYVGATGYFKMKSGASTVSKSSNSPSGSIAPGTQSVVLAKYDIRSSGEALEIRKIGVQVKMTNASGTLLTGSLVVRDASTGETYLSISGDTTGIQTGSTITAGTLLTYQQNLSSYITLNAGQTKSIEVVGNVSANASTTDTYQVGIGQLYAKRLSSNDYTTLAAAAYNANQLTVGGVSLSVSKSTSFANKNISAGASNVKIAEFILQASSADDIRVNTISLKVATPTNLQNLAIYEGTTQLGTTVGNPSTSGNTFSLSGFVVSKSQSKTISVYADVLSGAAGSSQVSVALAGVSGVGVSSGVSLSNTPASDEALQLVSLADPSITIAIDSSRPDSKIVLAGQSGVEVSKIKFEAKNEDLTLKKITLAVTTATGTMTSNIARVYLYDGSTLLNAGGTSVVSGTTIISGLNISLPQGTAKVLTVKIDSTDQATMSPKAVGGIKVSSTSTNDMEVYSSQGLMSSNVTLTSYAASENFLFTASAASVANSYTGGTSKVANGSDEIARFTVSNPGTREITLATMTTKVYLSGGSASSTVTSIKLYDANSNVIATSTVSSITGNGNATVSFLINNPTQAIAAGSSKTFIIKADTTGIETGVTNPGTTNVNLYVKLDGAKGYSASNSTTEPMWSDGVITYGYTTTDVSNTSYSDLSASDSGEVMGATLAY